MSAPPELVSLRDTLWRSRRLASRRLWGAQASVALALELLATGLVIGGFQVYLDLTAERGDEDTLSRRMLGRVLPAIISCGCLVICGATLAGQAGGGLYWLVPSVLSAIVFGLINVWVLLVEILR